MGRRIGNTESYVRSVIMEAARSVLFEDVDMDRDMAVKRKAMEALRSAGYSNIFGDNGYLTFNVSIGSPSEIGRIRSVLSAAVKPVDYDDLRVSEGYGMRSYCEVSLPSWTHSGLF